MRILLLLTIAAAVFAISCVEAQATDSDLLAALTALEDHVSGTTPLDTAQIDAQTVIIDANKEFFDANSVVVSASFDLIRTYDTTPGFGPLFNTSRTSFTRSSFTSGIHWAIYNVMQNVIDVTYSTESITNYPSLVDGFKFGSSSHFPGAVNPPADPEAIYTVTIDGSYPYAYGHNTMYTLSAARKPTGAYLAPGSIVTITVPSSIVSKGYKVRVGAHTWDHSNKKSIKRLDRCTVAYEINNTEVKVASPYGGGIYIEVPYLADEGLVNIQIKNAVRSPYFSAKSFHSTTLSEWQTVERNHPAPWADFQSEKFMMTVPTSWIYNYSDPITVMLDWDKAMDAMNDLMGFPHDRKKETMYPQIDVQNKASVFAPGYPSCNSSYSPNSTYGGNQNHYLLKGPQYAPDYLFHEEGHGYLFTKFGGERESNVNLLHVAVWHRKFGYDLDYAFAASRGMQSNPHKTLDNTAVTWMTSFAFSPREVPMADAEKAYQLKGHAKFVEIARLFGWDGLGEFWKSFNEDFENGVSSPSNTDGLLLRLSESAGVDIRPLFHFWGTHPSNNANLKAALADKGILPSATIYDTLVRYRSLVPADNAAFRTFALNWWGREPRITGNWTETEHARQWDNQILRDQDIDNQQRPNGEIYVESSAAQIRDVVDRLIELYFPDGRPFSHAGISMVTWSDEPVQLDPNLADLDDGDPQTSLNFAWSAHPSDGVVFTPNANVENPVVTITKPVGPMNTFILTLTVDDGVNPAVKDTVTIDVYDDACKASIGIGLQNDHPDDLVINCVTDLEDLALMLNSWLVDTSLQSPQFKDSEF